MVTFDQFLEAAATKREFVNVLFEERVFELIGTLQKQASQIQKVSARLAAGQSEARLVANDQSETSK